MSKFNSADKAKNESKNVENKGQKMEKSGKLEKRITKMVGGDVTSPIFYRGRLG